MRKWIIIIVVVLVIAGIGDCCDTIAYNRQCGKLERLISQKQYARAYRYANRKDFYATDIVSAHTKELLFEGNVSEARQVALDNEEFMAYYKILMSSLQSVYETCGISTVISALSSIPWPSPSQYYLGDINSGLWGVASYTHQRSIAELANTSLESLALYLKNAGKIQYISRILEFLQPYCIDTSGTVSYDEMNRIRSEFGL